ncbi:RBBP9/YdeN family alpha/beta hydrolase [Mesorhizobium atlanticum]
MKVERRQIFTIVPGYHQIPGPEHWRDPLASRNLSTARRVEQASPDQARAWRNGRRVWLTPSTRPKRPVVLVAHSLGVAAAVQAIRAVQEAGRRRLLRHAPPDVARPGNQAEATGRPAGPYSRDPLPFPSIVIASRNDPFCAFEVAEDIAAAWGSLFIDAGEAGHLNHDAGFVARGPRVR